MKIFFRTGLIYLLWAILAYSNVLYAENEKGTRPSDERKKQNAEDSSGSKQEPPQEDSKKPRVLAKIKTKNTVPDYKCSYCKGSINPHDRKTCFVCSCLAYTHRDCRAGYGQCTTLGCSGKESNTLPLRTAVPSGPLNNLSADASMQLLTEILESGQDPPPNLVARLLSLAIANRLPLHQVGALIVAHPRLAEVLVSRCVQLRQMIPNTGAADFPPFADFLLMLAAHQTLPPELRKLLARGKNTARPESFNQLVQAEAKNPGLIRNILAQISSDQLEPLQAAAVVAYWGGYADEKPSDTKNVKVTDVERALEHARVHHIPAQEVVRAVINLEHKHEQALSSLKGVWLKALFELALDVVSPGPRRAGYSLSYLSRPDAYSLEFISAVPKDSKLYSKLRALAALEIPNEDTYYFLRNTWLRALAPLLEPGSPEALEYQRKIRKKFEEEVTSESYQDHDFLSYIADLPPAIVPPEFRAEMLRRFPNPSLQSLKTFLCSPSHPSPEELNAVMQIWSEHPRYAGDPKEIRMKINMVMSVFPHLMKFNPTWARQWIEACALGETDLKDDIWAVEGFSKFFETHVAINDSLYEKIIDHILDGHYTSIGLSFLFSKRSDLKVRYESGLKRYRAQLRDKLRVDPSPRTFFQWRWLTIYSSFIDSSPSEEEQEAIAIALEAKEDWHTPWVAIWTLDKFDAPVISPRIRAALESLRRQPPPRSLYYYEIEDYHFDMPLLALAGKIQPREPQDVDLVMARLRSEKSHREGRAIEALSKMSGVAVPTDVRDRLINDFREMNKSYVVPLLIQHFAEPSVEEIRKIFQVSREWEWGSKSAIKPWIERIAANPELFIYLGEEWSKILSEEHWFDDVHLRLTLLKALPQAYRENPRVRELYPALLSARDPLMRRLAVEVLPTLGEITPAVGALIPRLAMDQEGFVSTAFREVFGLCYSTYPEFRQAVSTGLANGIPSFQNRFLLLLTEVQPISPEILSIFPTLMRSPNRLVRLQAIHMLAMIWPISEEILTEVRHQLRSETDSQIRGALLDVVPHLAWFNEETYRFFAEELKSKGKNAKVYDDILRKRVKEKSPDSLTEELAQVSPDVLFSLRQRLPLGHKLASVIDVARNTSQASCVYHNLFRPVPVKRWLKELWKQNPEGE